MPTYEYACTSCGHHLEVSQSFSDDPLTVCPNCGGPLRKVFGAIGIVLKGSGFYKTDSRSSPGRGGRDAGTGGSETTKEAPAKTAADGGSKSSTGSGSSEAASPAKAASS